MVGPERGIRLAAIPEERYADYRYEAIFKAYKWDPQVADHNTVARHVVLLDAGLAGQLAGWAEALAAETVALERALCKTAGPALARQLGLPAGIGRALPRLHGYDPERHVRLMRFDFHPTEDGWAVSEVNSDVPGGFAEASLLPGLAAPYFAGYTPGPSAGDALAAAYQRRLSPGSRVAFVYATSYADDRQVMQYLGDRFAAAGFEVVYAGPDSLAFAQGRARCLLAHSEGPVDGIVRFYPLEWLANLPRASGWQGYYDCEAVACNHPAAVFAQSKRLPLVWDVLDVPHPAWSRFLPETRDPRDLPPATAGWIYKPALGRVGEGISIPGTMPDKELRHIRRAARRHPRDWLAQRMFQSRPLAAPGGGEYHLCVGVFTIDGACAGYYARVSESPRIEAKAEDIPILVWRGEEP